jgi:hypothetical protein
MPTPVSLQIWLDEQAWPLGIIAVLLILAYVALRFSARRRREALARERDGVTEQSFSDYLTQFGFDATITASTYRYLQQVQRVSFPILPSDNLDEDLGLGHEDVEQTVRELSQALGRRLNPGLASAPVVTVEDLVRLLQRSPRIAKSSAA